MSLSKNHKDDIEKVDQLSQAYHHSTATLDFCATGTVIYDLILSCISLCAIIWSNQNGPIVEIFIYKRRYKFFHIGVGPQKFFRALVQCIGGTGSEIGKGEINIEKMNTER